MSSSESHQITDEMNILGGSIYSLDEKRMLDREISVVGSLLNKVVILASSA